MHALHDTIYFVAAWYFDKYCFTITAALCFHCNNNCVVANVPHQPGQTHRH